MRALAPLSPGQLAVPIRSAWPIWASVSHLAGARVYWLCHVFGEPGADTTPFTEREIVDSGWEDAHRSFFVTEFATVRNVAEDVAAALIAANSR